MNFLLSLCNVLNVALFTVRFCLYNKDESLSLAYMLRTGGNKHLSSVPV